MFKKTLLTFAGAAILACGSGEASAHTWWITCGSTKAKWASNVYTVRFYEPEFPEGPARDALVHVVNGWHSNPSNLGYAMTPDDPYIDFGNGESEIWWATEFGAPAATYAWWDIASCTFTEMDILFDANVSYTYSPLKTDLWSYGGAFRPFQTTAMHEFGHAGGLGHTSNTYSIMGSDWTHIHANGPNATAYHGEDAATGMVSVYGLWAGGPEDLGTAQWRRTGSSGEYSTHGRARVFNCSGIELPKVAGTIEPVYVVNKGQCVQLELTYENIGKTSPLSPKVGYYLSGDDTISTADTYLSSKTFKLYRDKANTSKNTLTIPSYLTSGQNYWLGAIIDYTNAISEKTEYNNATYVGIRVN